MFKFNHKDTRHQWHRSGVLNVNFEQANTGWVGFDDNLVAL